MSRLADIREQDATGKAADISPGSKKRWAKCRRLSHHPAATRRRALQQALAHNRDAP